MFNKDNSVDILQHNESLPRTSHTKSNAEQPVISRQRDGIIHKLEFVNTENEQILKAQLEKSRSTTQVKKQKVSEIHCMET